MKSQDSLRTVGNRALIKHRAFSWSCPRYLFPPRPEAYLRNCPTPVFCGKTNADRHVLSFICFSFFLFCLLDLSRSCVQMFIYNPQRKEKKSLSFVFSWTWMAARSPCPPVREFQCMCKYRFPGWRLSFFFFFVPSCAKKKRDWTTNKVSTGFYGVWWEHLCMSIGQFEEYAQGPQVHTHPHTHAPTFWLSF